MVQYQHSVTKNRGTRTLGSAPPGKEPGARTLGQCIHQLLPLHHRHVHGQVNSVLNRLWKAQPHGPDAVHLTGGEQEENYGHNHEHGMAKSEADRA